MGLQIESGLGNGKTAGVDDDNHLKTAAHTQSKLAFISQDKGKAFTIYGRRDFVAANTNEGILYFKYTGNKNFYIQSIQVAANTMDVSGVGNKVEIYLDSAYISGGTTVTPINLNRGSGNVLDALVYNGNTDLAVTAGSTEIVDFRLGADSYEWHIDNALVLAPNSVLYILGEVQNIGDKIRVMVLGFED